MEDGSQLGVLRALMSAGADLKVVDFRCRSMLHHAALYGNADLLQCLLDAGVDPNHFPNSKPLGHGEFDAILEDLDRLG